MNFLNNDGGEIHLIIGPMFSNKTSTLMNYLTKYANINYILIKYGERSHKVFTVSKLADISIPNRVKIIGIDEGQFFPDLVEYVDLWANTGYKIFIAALDGNFMREPFEQVRNLVPKSEVIEKHFAICRNCFKNKASFTKRIVGPVCRLCYLKLTNL